MLVLALIALALTGLYYHDLSNKVGRWEAHAERMKHASQHQILISRSGKRMPEDLALEVKNANKALLQLSLPWERLFQAVESAGSKEVALLALEPDTEKQMVKIRGEAKNIPELLDYIKRLEERDVFGTVYLQSHQVQQQDTDKPVRFALLAFWRERP